MTIFDTSCIIESIKKQGQIIGDTTIITLIEYPPLLEYSKFTGNVFYPSTGDFIYTIELQRRLRKRGIAKGASDLIIAAICIRNKEQLNTKDKDFEDIALVSDLKII